MPYVNIIDEVKKQDLFAFYLRDLLDNIDDQLESETLSYEMRNNLEAQKLIILDIRSKYFEFNSKNQEK